MTKESNEQTATFSEFAKVLRVKPAAVTQLKADDRLVLTEDGKRVRIEASLARIRETADPSRIGVVARHEAARRAQAPGVGEDDDVDADALNEDGDELRAQSGYQHWRERDMRAKALANERENAIADGKLMDVSDVISAVASSTTTLRTNLERLPSELAPGLAAISDEGQVRAILAEAIEQALDDLSRKFQMIGKGEQ